MADRSDHQTRQSVQSQVIFKKGIFLYRNIEVISFIYLGIYRRYLTPTVKIWMLTQVQMQAAPPFPTPSNATDATNASLSTSYVPAKTPSSASRTTTTSTSRLTSRCHFEQTRTSFRTVIYDRANDQPKLPTPTTFLHRTKKIQRSRNR